MAGTDAIRDGNHVPVALGVSSTDSTATVPFTINPSTGGLVIDGGGSGMAIGDTITSGTAGSVLFVGAGPVLAQDNSNLFWNDSSNFLGIGTASPASELHVVSVSASNPRGFIQDQITSDALGGRYNLRKARGSLGALTTIVTGDVLGRLTGWGYEGSSYLLMAQITMTSEGTIAATRVPTFMGFSTATNATPSVLTEAMRITSSQQVGIGYTVPVTELSVFSTSSADPRGILSAQYSTDSNGARIHFRKARGTPASSSIIVTGDMLGRLRFGGYDGSNFLQMGSIDVVSTGTIALTSIPTYMSFSTGSTATPSVLTEWLRITATGVIVAGTGEAGATQTATTIRAPLASTQASATAGTALTISASDAVAGNTNVGAAAGGAITISAGNAALLTSGGAAGGLATLKGGNGIGTGDAGGISILGGTGGTSGNGGDIAITAGGAGVGASDRGGNITITGGDGQGAAGVGGNVTITAGQGQTAAANSGSINLTGGAAGSSGAEGTDINITTADTNSSNRTIGDITITTGSHTGSVAVPGNGGTLTLTTGGGGSDSDATGVGANGGPWTLAAGSGGNASGNTNGTGGNGGTWIWTGGAGGNATGAAGTHLGGNGSSVLFTTGAGGIANGASGTRTGGNGGSFTITTGAAGTGASANGTAGIIQFTIGGTAIANYSAAGHHLWNTDNTYDIGAASATRPRIIYVGTNVIAPTVQTTAVAVASLPAAPVEGMRCAVNDSNAVSFTAGIGAVVAAGGTTHVPVYYDGTNWRIG